ncbi:MAG: hypothetical protein RLZZ126_286 [Pseudomonadota bacterium]|jgi:hypothetical protein
MENPWKAVSVPTDNYVHPADRQAWPSGSSLPPQPYLGSYLDGKVMWLLGGFGTGVEMAIEHATHRHTVIAWTQKNLGCDLPSVPNLWLAADTNDEALNMTRDVRWWRKATTALHAEMARHVGTPLAQKMLSTRLFVLEAFPYPAKSRPNRLLPTHAYTRHLLASWVESERPIVVGRAEKFWCQLEPRLHRALASGIAVRVKNVRAATISAGNLVGGRDDFSRLVAALLR